jgi:hypothetical protein
MQYVLDTTIHNQYFSYIVAVRFIGGGNREKTTKLPQVVSSTPHHERDSNFSGVSH